MTIGAFFKYVEIQTKVASQVPFWVAVLYAAWRFAAIDPLNGLLFFISLLAVDLTTTAVNNYQDHRKAKLKSGYGYEVHNAMVAHDLSVKEALGTIFGLLFVAALSGSLLALRTGWVTLLIGLMAVGVGILYSFGPLSINRTPYGEAVSGFFMGFLIPLLGVNIHLKTPLMTLLWQGEMISLVILWKEVLGLFLVTFPLVVGISNIMLANNLCDVEEDKKNERLTLVVALGREAAGPLMPWLYRIGYGFCALGVVFSYLPITGLFYFATLPLVEKNTRKFLSDPHKARTFRLVVKNFLAQGLALLLALGLALFLEVT